MIAHRTIRWYNNIASARFIFAFKVQIDKKASFCCSVRPFLGVSLWHREKREVQNMNTDKIYAEQLANEKACDIIGEAELGRPHHRLKRPDGTGAGGRRAGVAVQPRHTYCFALALIQNTLGKIRQVNVRQQRCACLKPAPETGQKRTVFLIQCQHTPYIIELLS